MDRLRDEAAKEKKNVESLTEIVAEQTMAEKLLRQRVHQQALVAEIGQQALAGAGLDDLIQEIVVQAARSLDVEFAVILELSHDYLSLKLRAGVGYDEQQQQHLPLADWVDPSAALYALRSNQSVIFSDLQTETRFESGPLLDRGVVSGVAVIIRNDQHPFGVLAAHSRRERNFTQDDVNFLQSIANVLATAIHRKRSEDELAAVRDQLAQQLDDMTQLHTLSGRLLNSKLDIQALIEEVLKSVTELHETTMGVIVLNQSDEQGRFMMASTGIDATSLAPFRPSDLLNPITIEDVAADPRFAAQLPGNELAYRSLHATQLQTRAGRTIGSFTAFFAEPRRPPSNQLWKVELYSRLAAEAIDNARLYQENQNSNRRKDEFLAMLAHELRNPLAPIRNALEILRHPNSDAAICKQARDMATRQVQHMTRLVDDLLDVSRISRGKIQLNKKTVEVGPIVERAVESTMPLFKGRNLSLDVNIPRSPIWLEVDPTRVEQVMVNLLNNAAKYTKAGGQVWVSAEADTDHAILRVRDNGIGIAADFLPRIFDMFVQAEDSADRSHGGLGIGLTLVRSLVSMHGGAVEARSEGPGKGSEFVVRLPRLPSAPIADGKPASNNSHRTTPGRRILVVDDNVDAAESLAYLLRTDGHEVTTAYDGLSAIDSAHKLHPDAVLLDIGLPGMSGHEVASRLRHDHPNRNLLLVALTGYGQEEDRRRSVEVGIDAHLTKPVDLADLRALLSSPDGKR